MYLKQSARAAQSRNQPKQVAQKYAIGHFQPSSDNEYDDEDEDDTESSQFPPPSNRRSASSVSLMLDGGSQDFAAERRQRNEETIADELRRYEDEGLTLDQLSVEAGILKYWTVCHNSPDLCPTNIGNRIVKRSSQIYSR